MKEHEPIEGEDEDDHVEDHEDEYTEDDDEVEVETTKGVLIALDFTTLHQRIC